LIWEIDDDYNVIGTIETFFWGNDRITEKMSDGAGKAPTAFGRSHMAIHFNHTILSAHDSKASAIFLAEMLNLPAPRRWGPFQMVVTENGANLDYMDTDGEITPQCVPRVRDICRQYRYDRCVFNPWARHHTCHIHSSSIQNTIREKRSGISLGEIGLHGVLVIG